MKARRPSREDLMRTIVEQGRSLVQQGHPLTLAAVGAAMDRTPQSLYYYLPSRMHLANLVTESIMDELWDLVCRTMEIFAPQEYRERGIGSIIVLRLWAHTHPSLFHHAFITYAGFTATGPRARETSASTVLGERIAARTLDPYTHADLVNLRCDPLPAAFREMVEAPLAEGGMGKPAGVGYPEMYWQYLRLWLGFMGLITMETFQQTEPLSDEIFAHLIGSSLKDFMGEADIALIHTVQARVSEFFATQDPAARQVPPGPLPD